MDTYVTLSCLLISGIVFVGWLIKQHFSHEKNFFDTLNKPLDNKDKWWYN